MFLELNCSRMYSYSVLKYFIFTGSKSMQEGWGEGEGSVSASRHSSWEEEEESGGVWNSAGSQGSSSSYSGGWGAKKGNKVRQWSG